MGRIIITEKQDPITDLDSLPFPDRSLVDYPNYWNYIGQAMVYRSLTLQATRGCPYKCIFCHNIFGKKHIYRSAENVHEEIDFYYQKGIRRFSFIDDIFNLNRKNSTKLFQMLIQNNPGVELFFPQGLRGDILTHDYIDMMIEAGTKSVALALETGSERMQKVIGKNLDIFKLEENLHYITKKYPELILELFFMVGLPGETEEESLKTIEFVKRIKWVHFPYLFFNRIYPNTANYDLAIQSGIPESTILESLSLEFHDIPSTIHFSRQFAQQLKSIIFFEYFLNKDRLKTVLPLQLQLLSKNEMVLKYNSYLPVEITNFEQLLKALGLSEESLNLPIKSQNQEMKFPDFVSTQVKNRNNQISINPPLKILLLDLSTPFSTDITPLYDVIEPPLGLISLLTYAYQKFEEKIDGKILKSKIDFDSVQVLLSEVDKFNPDLIGVRTLSIYKNMFHEVVTKIKRHNGNIPIITGGPYSTSDYIDLLQDYSIEAAIIGEGEITFSQIIEKMINNDNKWPEFDNLITVKGIAINKEKYFADDVTHKVNVDIKKDISAKLDDDWDL